MSNSVSIAVDDRVTGIWYRSQSSRLVNLDFYQPETERRFNPLSMGKLGGNGYFPLVSLSIAFVGTNIGSLGAYQLLARAPDFTNCQQILPWDTDSKRLQCATKAANTQEFPQLAAAIRTIKDWSADRPLYRQSQQLLQDWSQDVSNMARAKFSAGRYQEAISMLKTIPPNSKIYPQTRQLITKWSQEKDAIGAIESRFDRSLEQANWHHSFVYLQAVREIYQTDWNGKVADRLFLRLAKEQKAWDLLQAATDVLENRPIEGYTRGANPPNLTLDLNSLQRRLPNNSRLLAQALQILDTIQPDTKVYRQAQRFRDLWSKKLTDLASQPRRQSPATLIAATRAERPTALGSNPKQLGVTMTIDY